MLLSTSSVQGCVVWDRDQNLISWSSKCPDFWYNPEEALRPGMPMIELLRHIAVNGGFGDGDPDALAEIELKRVRSAGQNSGDEFQMLDGRVIHVQRISMEGGGHASTYTDITGRQQAEMLLRDRLEDYQQSARMVRVGHWLWDEIDERIISCSEECARIHGVTVEEYIASTSTIEQDIAWAHPEDRARFEKTVETSPSFDIDYRIITRDGRVRHVREIAEPEYDNNGVAVRSRGTIQDITQHKLIETALADSEKRYSDLFDHIPVSVWVEDWSAVKPVIDRIKEAGVEDINTYFHTNPIVTRYLADETTILDFNAATVGMYRAPSKAEFWPFADDDFMTEDEFRMYADTVAAFARGENKCSTFGWEKTFDGEEIYIRDTVFIPDEFSETWERVVHATEDISAQERATKQLLQLATIDHVTGLPNRALLFDRMTQAIEHAKRENRMVGLIFVDLDQFKQINDTRGHSAGDHLLKQVGGRLGQLVRQGDTVARLGGDEFIILLHDIDQSNDTEVVAKKIVDAFQLPFDIEKGLFYVTGSLGVSVFPHDGEDPETLLQNADVAMYKSKRQGRNTYHLFTPGLDDEIERVGHIAEKLRHAMDRREFELFFQPIIDVHDESVVAVEALIRWNNSTLEVISPDKLITIAEDAGFVIPIDKWVLNEACRQVAAWRAEVAPELKLNLNVSGSHFRDTSLTHVVQQALVENRLPAEVLTIEITENLLIEETSEIAKHLGELAGMGVKLALDDFGKGYSSLGHLRKFKVNTLKIDRSFVQNIAHRENDLTLVETIIAMGHGLGLTVVAEGVENATQLELIRAKGCSLIQGFHFSEPLPISSMTEYLTNRR